MGVACSVSSDRNYLNRETYSASFATRTNPFDRINQRNDKVAIYTANSKPAKSIMMNPFEFLTHNDNSKGVSHDTSADTQTVVLPRRLVITTLQKENANPNLKKPAATFRDPERICEICMESSRNKFGRIEKCGHTFHIPCMKPYLNWAIAARQLSIKCPDAKCSKYLSLSDIENFLDGQDLRNFYSIWGKLNQKEVVYCGTPGCNRAIILNGENHVYCLGCFAHINFSGSNDREFETFATANKFKQCTLKYLDVTQ